MENQKKRPNISYYNKKILIATIISCILAIWLLTWLIRQKSPKNGFVVLLVLLIISTCVIVIALDITYFIRMLMNYGSVKWQEIKYTTQTQNLMTALYNVPWPKEPIYAFLNSMSDDKLKIPPKSKITQEINGKSYVNQYLLYSQLVEHFSQFEEERLKNIKSFLSIEYYKFTQKINSKIILTGIFWVLLIFLIIFVPQGAKIDFEKINTVKDLIKILILDSSGLIRTLVYSDPVSFAFLCIYLFLLLVLLPLVIIDRDVRVHNETKVVLAAVGEALEEKMTTKNNSNEDTQNTDVSSNGDSDSKVKNEEIQSGSSGTSESDIGNDQGKEKQKSRISDKFKQQLFEKTKLYVPYVGYVVSGVLILSAVYSAIKFGFECGNKHWQIHQYVHAYWTSFTVYYQVYFLVILALCIVGINIAFQIYDNEKLNLREFILIGFLTLNMGIAFGVLRPFVESCTQSNYINAWLYNVIFFFSTSCMVVGIIFYSTNTDYMKEK